jgi:TPP-dependent indolepyruvate ferredoxin oxidoreductase alpha subunit
MVAEEVKAFIEKEVKPVLCVYKKIAMGVKRKRFHPKTGEKYFEIEYDPATVRDWVAKFVPSVHRKENTGADGRPLVPWTVVAPDPDAFPPEPGPESEQPADTCQGVRASPKTC